MRALISKECIFLHYNFAYNNCNSVQVFDLSVPLFCTRFALKLCIKCFNNAFLFVQVCLGCHKCFRKKKNFIKRG